MGCLCVLLGQCDERRRVWRGRLKYVYKFFVGDGEIRRDFKWLTCLDRLVVCALCADGCMAGCPRLRLGRCREGRRVRRARDNYVYKFASADVKRRPVVRSKPLTC